MHYGILIFVLIIKLVTIYRELKLTALSFWHIVIINVVRVNLNSNYHLDKNFVKDLSTKLLEWTNQRWIISFSKIKGSLSIKEEEKNKQAKFIENAKLTDLYKTTLKNFSDAELMNIKLIESEDE